MLESGLYAFVVGDGQARSPKKVRLVNGGSDRSPGGVVAWLGWGGFSWRSVLPLVPGIWEAPSARDFTRWRKRGGAAHHGPGVRPFKGERDE